MLSRLLHYRLLGPFNIQLGNIEMLVMKGGEVRQQIKYLYTSPQTLAHFLEAKKGKRELLTKLSFKETVHWLRAVAAVPETQVQSPAST